VSDTTWFSLKLSNYFAILFSQQCECGSKVDIFENTKTVGQHYGCAAKGYIHVYWTMDEEKLILPSTAFRCDRCGGSHEIHGRQIKEIKELRDWIAENNEMSDLVSKDRELATLGSQK